MMLHRDNGSAGGKPDARLAHELSNLLDGSLRHVSLALGRLNEQADGAADARTIEGLRTASDAMRHMAGLLEQWMRQGGSALRWAHDTPLEETIDRAVSLVRPQAEQQRISVEVNVPSDVAAVRAGALEPVIGNAVRNAIQAIGESGSIVIEACRDGESVELRIADDGPGVALMVPRDADGLVQPGVTTRDGGHGLGLAISRDIVRGLGGTLRLVDRPAGGTALIVRWTPLQPHEPSDE